MVQWDIILKITLKQAGKNFVLSNYSKAINLYEEALNLIRTDTDNYCHLTDFDVCVIKYSLCNCYITQKEYLDKASNELIPLTVAHGNLFPTLYYGLAKLCFTQCRFQQTESVINNGLKVLNIVKAKTIFKANWSGTDIEIPESNVDVLIRFLNSLKEQTINKMEDSDVYHSDELEEDDTILLQNKEQQNLKTETGNLPEEKESENKVYDTKNVQGIKTISNLNMTDRYTTVLNADVPEFIPRNLKNSSFIIDNCSAVNSEPKSKVSPRSEDEVNNSAEFLHSLEKCSQTNFIKMVEKAVQMEIKLDSVFTQTSNFEEPICNCKQQMEEKEQFFLSKLLSLADENEELQIKVEDLQKENQEKVEELEEFHKQNFLKDQQDKLVSENLVKMAWVKLESHNESLQDKISKLEAENKQQQEKIENSVKNNGIMHSVITTQAMQYFSLQRRVVTDYICKCRKMIFDLGSALPHLTARTIPTQTDCQRHITQWEKQLKETENYLVVLQDSYEKTIKDVHLGNFSEISNFFIFTQFTEPNDILHDSFVPAVNTLQKENMQYYQQNAQFRQQNTPWWRNPYEVVYQPRTTIVGPPMYYNVPQGPPVGPTPKFNEVTSRGATKSSIAITSPSINDKSPSINFGILNTPQITEISTSCAEAVTTKSNKPSKFSTTDCDISNNTTADGSKNDNNSTLNQTVSKAFAKLADLTISSEKKVCLHSVIDERKQETTLKNSLDYSSEFFTKLNLEQAQNLNKAEGLTVTEKPSNEQSSTIKHSKDENLKKGEVFYFEGTSNDSKLELPSTFYLKENNDLSTPSSSGTSNKNQTFVPDNHLILENSSAILHRAPKNVDYSQLPDAVRKAGRNFCDLYYYVRQRIPEKTDMEIFSALKRVRRKNTKLSGMTKDDIVIDVRTELKVDLESDGNMVAKSAEAKGLNTNCIVCIEPFGNGPITELPCQHTFHKKCIKQWFVYKNDCPVCRVLVV